MIDFALLKFYCLGICGIQTRHGLQSVKVIVLQANSLGGSLFILHDVVFEVFFCECSLYVEFAHHLAPSLCQALCC